jgi:hypothetical protein
VIRSEPALMQPRSLPATYKSVSDQNLPQVYRSGIPVCGARVLQPRCCPPDSNQEVPSKQQQLQVGKGTWPR